MGDDRIRHLVTRRYPGGVRYYWAPSATLKSLGLSTEALGTDDGQAKRRATELNGLADQVRRGAKVASNNGPLPGSVARLFKEWMGSDEFADLKPRTQRDYRYYADKIETDFGKVMVRALTARVIKTYYKRMKTKSVTWAYHILGTFRVALSWAVSEDWIAQNPALDVRMKSPQRRTVTWSADECAVYLVKAAEMGWDSIVAMAHVFDSIGQSPVDVRTLRRGNYDGKRMATTRAKTGVGGAPIPLFPAAVEALDAYLATRTALHPNAPLFEHDKIGGEWNESTLGKAHRKIRKAAGLRPELQLQDFRTSAATEGGAAGGTVDELRGLQRHSSRDAGEHYVYPDDRYVESIQQKRLDYRNKIGAKVE